MILKEYGNISLSFDSEQNQHYSVLLKDVVIKAFNHYNEALQYFKALCSLRPGGGYPSEQFETNKEDSTSTYDSSNDKRHRQ